MIDLPLVSLDLELLDGDNGAEIIEVGAVKFRGDVTLGTFSALVKPAGQLSHRIGELTGLGSAELAEADDLGVVLPRLSTFVGGAPLVGQSIGFDVDHLARAGLGLRNPQLDTFELAMLVRRGLASYDLQSVARDLGIDVTQPHRALPDALLARDVFLRLVERVEELDLDTLSHVVRLAGPLDWPLKLVFAEAQRQRVRQLLQTGHPLDVGAGRGLPSAMPPPERRPPLEPRERIVPLDIGALLATLEPDGPVARAVSGYEERGEQREMLAAVAEAFNEGETLLVEAGTGIGKSLAYLLPSLHFAVANDRRVVISTNTINLQDQLCEKDLPDLLRATGLPARATVLKGRNNYLCLRRWQSLLGAPELSAAERRLLIKTLLWLPRTTTGDRAELRLTPDEEDAWARLAAVVESCSPLRCPFHRDGTCFVARARRAAEDAHLVIVNHSLLLADILTGNQVLPECRHLVVDEAHHLEDEATAQLSERTTEREALRHLNDLAAMPGSPTAGLLAEATAAARQAPPRAGRPEAVERLATRGEAEVRTVRAGLHRLFKLLGDFARTRTRPGEGAQATVRVTSAARAQPVWSEIDILWGEVGRDVLALQRTLAEMIAGLEEGPERDERLTAAAAELAAQGAFWESTRQRLSRVIAEHDGNTVAWLSLGQGGEVGVNAAPLHVGEIVRDQLVGRKETVVLTSATLTSEGSFRYIRERLGLFDARELTVGSPFDYAASALVYLPSDGPEPGQPGYQRAVERTILDAATELGGRTLVLFTSHNHLRTTHGALRDALDARKVVLLAQRIDGSSRSRLLETFKSGRSTVLMGTSSFWEGIDVVGEALSCLIIARLPFAMPTDPIVEARSEQFEDPFVQYSLPQAVLRFRQGFGRLIRSRTDRGVLIVLDGRLRTRAYRSAFLRSLPPCEVRSGPLGAAGQAARSWIEAARIVDLAGKTPRR